MKIKTVLIIYVIFLFVSVAIYIVARYYINKTKDKAIVNNKVTKDKTYNYYLKLSKFKLYDYYVNYIKSKIARVSSLDYFELNKSAFKLSLKLLGVSLFLIIFTINTADSLFYTVVSVIFIGVIHNELLISYCEKKQINLLEDFNKFLDKVRHNYHELNMIDDAVFYTIDEFSGVTQTNIKLMYEALANPDAETKVNDFVEIVQDKYFKTFISLAYLAQKFGDVNDEDGRSVFLKNLTYLKQDLNNEILKRKMLLYIFKSISFIVIAPIFLIKPLEHWCINNLSELANYFNTVLSFTTELFTLFVIGLCYAILNKMKSTQQTQENTIISSIYDRLLSVSIIRNLVSTNFSKNYTKNERLKKTLHEAGYRKSISHYNLSRLLMFGLGFFVSIFISIKSDDITRNAILNPISVVSEDVRMDETQKFEEYSNELLQSAVKKQIPLKKLETMLRNNTSRKISDEVVQDKALEIYEKAELYNKQYFKWYELIIAFAVAYLFSYIPYGLLLFKKKQLVYEIEEEIAQFQSIALMLMNIDRIDVLNILEWFEMFSSYFKDSLAECINSFGNGDVEALEQLKERESFEEFERLVDKLISSCNKIPIRKAFDELETERSFYNEKVKQETEMSLNDRKAIGNFIAFIPLMCVIIVKLVIPFVMMGMQNFSTYSSNMSGMFLN